MGLSLQKACLQLRTNQVRSCEPLKKIFFYAGCSKCCCTTLNLVLPNTSTLTANLLQFPLLSWFSISLLCLLFNPHWLSSPALISVFAFSLWLKAEVQLFHSLWKTEVCCMLCLPHAYFLIFSVMPKTYVEEYSTPLYSFIFPY